MQAVVYGRAKGAFELVTLPVPQPSASQLRVRVHAVALNPLDYKLPSMLPFFLRCLMPGKQVCFDFAGVVDEVGASCPGFKPGDRVYGNCTQGGALAQFTITGPDDVALLPSSVSFAAAASLPGSGLTSIQAMRGHLKQGDSLLVFGASGGCGSLAIQMAKALGASKVVGVCSSANAEAARALGCDVVAPYDGGEEALEAALRAVGPFDLAYDTVTSPEDRDYEPLSRKVLKPGGLHLALNAGGGDWMRMLMGMPRKGYLLMLKQSNAAQLAEIAAWVESGVVQPQVARECAFTEEGVAEAFALISSRRAKGKVVVNVISA